jgi:hypothetical protein
MGLIQMDMNMHLHLLPCEVDEIMDLIDMYLEKYEDEHVCEHWADKFLLYNKIAKQIGVNEYALVFMA